MLHKVDNPLSQCNLKFDNDNGKFEGYASVFNSNDNVNDTILPGAFKSAEGLEIPLFINHQHNEIPVGMVVGYEDRKGFFVEGEINLEHKNGPSLHSAMKRGHITGQSIGFTMSKDDYEQKNDGGRVIKNLILRENSIVTFPCEPKAMVTAVKSMADLEDIRDLEWFIRDEFAISKNMASTFLSHAKRILSGDLLEAEKQIEELTKRINRKTAVNSLIATLDNLGIEK